MIIACENCKAQFKLKKEPESSKALMFKCPKCGKSSKVQFSTAKKTDVTALIAHDDAKVISVIKNLIESLNINIISAQDGYEAYDTIKTKKPEITIIDVALSGIFGFELCERIKNDPELVNVKVILVASIYDRTRYKRKPQNLYGADDYIEKHHIPDKLFDKVANLLKNKISKQDIKQSSPAPNLATEQLKDNRDILLKKKEDEIEEQREEIRKHEQNHYEKISDLDGRAKKLARLIVSDIALYNQEILSGLTISNYKDKLQMDVNDGINHLAKKIPEIADRAPDYLHQAFNELIMKKSKKD